MLERLTVKDVCLEIVIDIAGDVETFNGGVEIATEGGKWVVRCGDALDVSLDDAINNCLLEGVASEDVLVSSELDTLSVGDVNVRFSEDVPTAEDVRNVLFTEGRAEELEPTAVVSFGDTLELFLAGTDELRVRNEETMVIFTVLVI